MLFAKADESGSSSNSSRSDGDHSSNGVHQPSGREARGHATIVDGAGHREVGFDKKHTRDGAGSAADSCHKQHRAEDTLAKKWKTLDHRVLPPLDVVQLVNKVTRWAGTWGPVEINQMGVLCNTKFSHGCEKLGMLRARLDRGYNVYEEMHGEKAWRAL